MRQVAMISTPAVSQEPQVLHYSGLPPELTDGEDLRVRLPWPRVLVLEATAHGEAFLYRLAEQGVVGGDTWHPTIEEAKSQARLEFGDLLGEWKEVPSGEKDAFAFAQRLVEEAARPSEE